MKEKTKTLKFEYLADSEQTVSFFGQIFTRYLPCKLSCDKINSFIQVLENGLLKMYAKYVQDRFIIFWKHESLPIHFKTPPHLRTLPLTIQTLDSLKNKKEERKR